MSHDVEEDLYYDARYAALLRSFRAFDPPNEMQIPQMMETRRDLQAMLDYAVTNIGVRSLMFFLADSLRVGTDLFTENCRDHPDIVEITADAARWVAFLMALGQGHTDVSLDSPGIAEFANTRAEKMKQVVDFRTKVFEGLKTKS